MSFLFCLIKAAVSYIKRAGKGGKKADKQIANEIE